MAVNFSLDKEGILEVDAKLLSTFVQFGLLLCGSGNLIDEALLRPDSWKACSSGTLTLLKLVPWWDLPGVNKTSFVFDECLGIVEVDTSTAELGNSLELSIPAFK